MAKNDIINYYHLEWRDFDYIYQDTLPPVGTTEYEKIKKEIKEKIKEGIKLFDCSSKMLEDYNRPLHLKSFSSMYERLTKKIVEMFKSHKEKYPRAYNKYMFGITTPDINSAVLVNKIALKYGNNFKVIVVKDDFKFRFPVEYISGDASDYEKLIGCGYHDLYKGICDIDFFNSINLELDPAQQLRAGLIKRGF